MSRPPPEPAPRLIYVTGGARSGKSRFAEGRALALGAGGVTYLATAQALDDEMTARIGRHRAGRPASWTTVEEPGDLEGALRGVQTPVALLDCLSLWVSNRLLAGDRDDDILARVEALGLPPGRTLIVVSNEVGQGVVPVGALARRYRDLLGWANQRVAGRADEAYLLVSGLPVTLKGP